MATLEGKTLTSSTTVPPPDLVRQCAAVSSTWGFHSAAVHCVVHRTPSRMLISTVIWSPGAGASLMTLGDGSTPARATEPGPRAAQVKLVL